MNEDEYKSIIEFYKHSCWRPIECRIGSIETILLYRDPCTPLICDVRKEWPSTYRLCYLITKTFFRGQLSVIPSDRILKFVFDECDFNTDVWADIIRDCIWRKDNASMRQYIYMRCRNMIANEEYNRKLIRLTEHFEGLRRSDVWRKYNKAVTSKLNKRKVLPNVMMCCKHCLNRCDSFKNNLLPIIQCQCELYAPCGKCDNRKKVIESMNVKCKWRRGKLRIIRYTKGKRNHMTSIKYAMLAREEGNFVFTIPKYIVCDLIKICKEKGYMSWQK